MVMYIHLSRAWGQAMRSTFLDADYQSEFDSDGYVIVSFLSNTEAAGLRAQFDRLGPGPGDVRKACESLFHSFDLDYKLNVGAAIPPTMAPTPSYVLT